MKSRYGDCNAHPSLYADMARAAGIPTVITVGLVYQGGAFYYHAWNASYIGGKWVFVDPVRGEFPASPMHILLSVGGLADQAKIAPVVGKLKVEILDVQYK